MQGYTCVPYSSCQTGTQQANESVWTTGNYFDPNQAAWLFRAPPSTSYPLALGGGQHPAGFYGSCSGCYNDLTLNLSAGTDCSYPLQLTDEANGTASFRAPNWSQNTVNVLNPRTIEGGWWAGFNCDQKLIISSLAHRQFYDFDGNPLNGGVPKPSSTNQVTEVTAKTLDTSDGSTDR
jgi:hypothetical protein